MGIISGGKIIEGSGLDAPLLCAGAPVDGTTYAGVAAVGAVLIDTINKNTYRNTGTQASPVWDAIGVISGDLPFTIIMPFTLGNRGGAQSDGVLVGELTHTAVDAAIQEDNSGAAFIDETADANNATQNDVEVPDPFDTNDALYIGYSERFCGVKIDIGTQGAGDAVVAEVAWEYWDGDSWEALTEVTDDSAAGSAAAGNHILTFLPPSDWATTTVNSQGPFYYIRARATADDVYNSTQAKWDQLWVIPLDVGEGIRMPFAGTITAVDMQANTASATNDDTELLLVNITQATFAQLTWTGGDQFDQVSGLSLAVADGDELAVFMLQEDGTTEFADCALHLEISN